LDQPIRSAPGSKHPSNGLADGEIAQELYSDVSGRRLPGEYFDSTENVIRDPDETACPDDVVQEGAEKLSSVQAEIVLPLCLRKLRRTS
jgi:hypothetical protein